MADPQQDPWAEEAAKMNAGKPAQAPGASPAPAKDDDWKIWNTTSDSATPTKSAPTRFVQAFNEGFGIPTSVQDHPSEAWEGVKTAVKHPSTLLDSLKTMASGIMPAQNAAYEQGKKEITSPGVSNKIAGGLHMVESGIPFIGPALVNADNKIGQGDIAGGLGSVGAATTQAASMHPGSTEIPANAIDLAKRSVPTKANATRVMDNVALGKETPPQILTRAIKPPVSYPEFEKVVGDRLPEMVRHAQTNGTPIDTVKNFETTADSLAKSKNADYQGLLKKADPEQNVTVDASPIADAQKNSIPATELQENPSVYRKTVAKADQAWRPVTKQNQFGIDVTNNQKTLPQLDAVREDTNAKLRDFYGRSAGDQNAALSNPETARTKATNDASRELLYNEIQKRTGEDPAPIQNAYGDYIDLGNVAGKRNTVFSRQNPFPLQEQVNAGQALAAGKPAQFAMAKLFKRYGDSNALTDIAIRKYMDTMRAQHPELAIPFKPGAERFAIGAGQAQKKDEE